MVGCDHLDLDTQICIHVAPDQSRHDLAQDVRQKEDGPERYSKLYVDALIHDQAEIPRFVSLYASINKMRVVSDPGIAERADKVVRIIVDTYVLPNKSFREVRAMMENGALDPLHDFSEACHEELSLLSSQALQFEYRRA